MDGPNILDFGVFIGVNVERSKPKIKARWRRNQRTRGKIAGRRFKTGKLIILHIGGLYNERMDGK